MDVCVNPSPGPASGPAPTAYISVHLVLVRPVMVIHYDMDFIPSVPIRVLKEELTTQLGMPADEQLWFFRNRLMNDEHSLERAGVIQRNIVEVRPLPRRAAASAFFQQPAEVSAEGQQGEHSREVLS